MAEETMSPPCPGCGKSGSRVEAVTLDRLLSGAARARIEAPNDFRFCKTADCEVVYFRPHDGVRFAQGDLRVPVFQKSRDPARPVCYCFDLRVGELEDEVARTGASSVLETVAENCRRGLDRCDEVNPQGSCCLGNLRLVVANAQTRKASAVSEDCCDPPDVLSIQQPSARRVHTRERGAVSAGAAVFASALASACCWVPLLFVAMGASAAGVGAIFAAYRPYLLGVTALLLGAGVYFVYVRKPACEPGTECFVPNRKAQRTSKVLLWIAAAGSLAFAAMPNYISPLLAGPSAGTASADSRTYSIEGMSCAGCAIHVETAIGELESVSSVEVSYPDKTARVFAKPGARVVDDDVFRALDAIGYRAAPIEP